MPATLWFEIWLFENYLHLNFAVWYNLLPKAPIIKTICLTNYITLMNVKGHGAQVVQKTVAERLKIKLILILNNELIVFLLSD